MLSVAITVVIALWAGRTIEARLLDARGMDLNFRIVLSKLVKTLLVIVAILIALPAVGIDVTVLSVFGGAVGVGLGLGLQKIAANYVSGFVILLDRSISPGALVTIDGRYGEVTKLTARYVVVKGMDGTEAIIPNETVITSVVVNHSYSDRSVRVDVPIQVSYTSDVDRALELMLEAARGHTRVLRNPAPAALLKGFADSGIDLELYVWVADPEAGTGNLRSDIYRAIWKSFNANNIAIPFPQREVRILPLETCITLGIGRCVQPGLRRPWSRARADARNGRTALEIPQPGRNLAWCRSYALPRKFLPQVPLLYNVGRPKIGNKLNLI